MARLIKFYKYMTIETALVVLTDSTLKFTKPTKFNDPYDFNPRAYAAGLNKFSSRLNEEYSHTGKPIKKGHTHRESHLRLLRSHQFREISLAETSISCFSKSPFILPMWAFYADHHKGCVIEFTVDLEDDVVYNDVVKNPINPSYLVPLEVEYSNSRPSYFDENGRTNSEKSGFKACLVKAESWSYEQELRVIKNVPEAIYPFPIQQINSILVGMKTSIEDIKKLQILILKINKEKKTKMKIKKISMKYDSYDLTEIQI